MLCVHRRAARTLELRQQPVPPCRATACPSLSLPLARSLASSRVAISPSPSPPPPRRLGPGRVSLAKAAHGMHDAARLLAALGPAGCSGYHHRTSSWSSLRNWRWRLRSTRRVTRAPAKQAPRTRPAHAMHTPCTRHAHVMHTPHPCPLPACITAMLTYFLTAYYRRQRIHQCDAPRGGWLRGLLRPSKPAEVSGG